MKINDTFPSTLAEAVCLLKKQNNGPRLTLIEKNGHFKNYTAKEYYKQIERVAKALVETGFEKGDSVGIFSNSRHEWSVCDLAAACIGCIVVPIYPNMTSEDLAYILNHSACKILFVENRSALRQVMVIKEQCPALKHIVLFDPPQQTEGDEWISFNEFMSGLTQRERQSFHFENRCRTVRPTDEVTIIYTSGTTGVPKGVLLTHQNIISEIYNVFSALQITEDDHSLSFLPYSHVLGRLEHWGNLVLGYRMTYSSGLEKLADELPLVNPTVIVTVPRILERFFIGLKAKIETSYIDSKLFKKAQTILTELAEKEQVGQTFNWKDDVSENLAQWFFSSRIKSSFFGNKLRFILSGGAGLNWEILNFFSTCGIQILEGYGLTETSGAICVNRPYDLELGTVGKPLEKMKIKIAHDGEILVQGPTVMKGYFKSTDKPSKFMKQGWFSTGDIGELTKNGNLIIKDRKKDLIKTATGKYVAPQKIESLFKQLPFVSYVHIHGDEKNYIVALITLNRNYLFTEARSRNIPFKSIEDLKEDPAIKELIRQGIMKVNSSLAAHEAVKNFAVLSEDFSIEGGEITPSLKVKRRIVDQKYQDLIRSLY